ncbi:RDD family protein [Corynebacterium confusum]|uniref:RDD family protein n=1 Tax=Corynebacterium confusum TaxID=71254 RepID=UPI0025B46D28|nr:RDD family protein [Corynebacterium confusum]
MAGRDARLQSLGESEQSPQRREAQLVFSVLSNPQRRELYDAAISAGRSVDWSDLEHLANFDCWPDPNLARPVTQADKQQPQQAQHTQHTQQFFQQPQRQAETQQGSPYGQPQTQYASPASPYAQPFNPHQVPTQSANLPAAQRYSDAVAANPEVERIAARPSAGGRFGMALFDGFLATAASGLVGGLLAAGGGVLSDAVSGTLGAVVFTLLCIAYFLGFETYMGGTPVKRMMGYKVANVETGRNLTLGESAKRQWFRVVQIIPGLGSLVSMGGSLFVLASISPSNELRGSHDRWADAEVTKKPRQQ